MSTDERKKLPYRKNCEGYFLYEGKVIARDAGSFIEFPGGGVEENEKPEEALKREAFEEAGIVLEENLTKIGVLHFDWGPDWAKTEKQKERYKKYCGEEMHFFTGKIKKIITLKSEDAWKGEKAILIDKTIQLIKEKPFGEEMREYRTFQISSLKRIK